MTNGKNKNNWKTSLKRMKMSNLVCIRCGFDTNDNEIHSHHVIPKCLKGSDDRINLCKRCHDEIHFTMLRWVWTFVPDSIREKAKDMIRIKTKWFINNVP